MNKLLKLIALLFVLIMLSLPVLGEMMGNGMMRGNAKEMHEEGRQMPRRCRHERVWDSCTAREIALATT